MLISSRKESMNMIKREEGTSTTSNQDEPETVLMPPHRHEEANRVTEEGDQIHLSENERAGKALEEETIESSTQPENHHNCIIDIKSSNESVDDVDDSGEEKVCRICHISSEHQSRTSDLIQLGCRCKNELGISHRDCAEIWFMHRGSRQCEICGHTATNVRGIRSSGFLIQRNERRLVASSTVSTVSSDSNVSLSCCWGQRFCNFILTCTVLAFLLPWFFRLDFFGG